MNAADFGTLGTALAALVAAAAAFYGHRIQRSSGAVEGYGRLTDDLQEERTALKEERTELKKQLDDVARQLTEARTQLAAALTEATEARTQLAAALTEAAQLRAEMVTLRAQMGGMTP